MTTKKKPNFLRRANTRYAKLGRGVKKNQKWRRPTGRDNKMREKRKGYPAVVSVGYKSDKIKRGTLKTKEPITIMNLKDLEKIKESGIGVVGNLGKKKKLEIAKKAREMKIPLYNMNAEKFLKLNEKKNDEKNSGDKK